MLYGEKDRRDVMGVFGNCDFQYMGDKRDVESFVFIMGKGKLIFYDDEYFGLMQNDGLGQLSVKGCGWE